MLDQFSQLKISRFEIVLQAQKEAILPALIGSTLRGAFGHALKAISCSVQHRDCERCFLSEVCLYPTIFEPTSTSSFRDLPRPFIFEPPVPPLTREISNNRTLKMRIPEKGKISFGLTLIGESAKKLPYFIYAFELMARHGLGAQRQPFSVSDVFSIDADGQKTLIYEPRMPKPLLPPGTNLAELVEKRIAQIKLDDSLKIKFQTPVRIRRNGQILERITFSEFFKQCLLRIKFLAESYAVPLEFDYKSLMKKAEDVRIIQNNLWRHNSMRFSNRQETKLSLDGMLGEIDFQYPNFPAFLPFICACEFFHIGHASNLGFGMFFIGSLIS